MRTTWAIVGLVLIGMVASGCDKEKTTPATPANQASHLSRKDLHKQLVSKLEAMASILKAVQDETSADKAAPKVTATADELRRIGRQIQSLGLCTTQDTHDIDQQFGARRKAALAAIETEGKRIEADPRLAAVSQALEQIRSTSGNGADD